MSLGGKRYTKNDQPKSTSIQSKVSNSIVPALERRWSVVGASWNRKKGKQSMVSADSIIDKSTLSAISNDNVWDNISVSQSQLTDQTLKLDDVNENRVEEEKENDLHMVPISKSDYEEIKDRVSAIETRISKEFGKIQSKLLNDSLDSVDMTSHLNGPEKVLEKFERAMEETESINLTPTTEHLARRLSRDLKIRRSAEQKVFRSPSARKIGSIRRRSQENVRLSRNKSWHMGANSCAIRNRITETATKISPKPVSPSTATNDVFMQPQIRSSLRRGRPNTVQTGLRLVQSGKASTAKSTPEIPMSKFSVFNTPKDIFSDLQNEQWICGDVFFDDNGATPMNVSMGEAPSSDSKPIQLARKQLNMDDICTPPFSSAPPTGKTPRSANSVNIIDTMKTPMLPPRTSVVKKTPASAMKSPRQGMAMAIAKSHLTPLWQQEQQQMGGRASIARLRSQNAGMVMAKAKLFDELVIEPKTVKQATNPSQRVNQVQHFATNGNQIQKNKHELESKLRSKINNASRKNGNGSNCGGGNKATPNRYLNVSHKNSPIGIQRRRANRNTPVKKSPAMLNGAVHTLNDINRNRNSALAFPDHCTGSPMTRRMTGAIESTPQVKRNVMNKNPRRLVRTPQGKKNVV